MPENRVVMQTLRVALVAVCAILAAGRRAPLAQPGQSVAPADDNPVYAAYRLLEKTPAYHMRFTMSSNDPNYQKMMASGMGMGTIETTVQGATRQASMRFKIPAMDIPGKIDDWEVRAAVQNGHAARKFFSDAIPRLIAQSEQKVAMELAMLDMQASRAIAMAALTGPFGAISAGMTAGATAMAHVEAGMMLKKQREFFEWKCQDAPGGKGESRSNGSKLTDVKAAGDEIVDGIAATRYEFFVHEGDTVHGPIRILIGKESGIPLRMNFDDPGGKGSMRIDYNVQPQINIEMPPCMGGRS
jgi:hypothetical protein